MKLKRREFLTAGAAAMAAASLLGDATAQEAPPGEEHPVGDFVLRRSANSLQISHRGASLIESSGRPRPAATFPPRQPRRIATAAGVAGILNMQLSL
jgi:hypothetical protein